MRNKFIAVLGASAVLLLTAMGLFFWQRNYYSAEEISFDKCLKVITTSQDKLSITPEINKLSDQKRVAVFTLIDGTLTITCDGQKGIVTVSTNTN